jgi:transcriptional regulator with XRE-family HTH domain
MQKKELNNRFGKRIRELRKREDNMSLRELARRTAISKSYLSDIEHGKLPPPAIPKILAIARELKEDPLSLLSLLKKPECDLKTFLKEHPEIAELIAHVCIELPYRLVNPAIVAFTAQSVISEQYGKKLNKPSNDILNELTEEVKKVYLAIKSDEQ